MNKKYLTLVLMMSTLAVVAQQRKNVVSSLSWPEAKKEAKPYTRWWWLGSAVDEAGLEYNMSEYHRAGIGGVEITPIYGVEGNDNNEIPYLSSSWMKMLGYTQKLGLRYDMDVEMANGTGWPFGGPEVSLDEAACKLQAPFNAVTIGRTKQKVKRAAPGGEGFVIDHFDKDAVARYLEKFDKAFRDNSTTFPPMFFNDSYEVYGADWTPTFVDEFKRRRGYDIRDYWDEFIKVSEQKEAHDTISRGALVLSDYRETLGELLLENFTRQWTSWAHSHNALTRNQAHGSPANLIDIYSAVDIPECEGFGLSDFGIKGLRVDAGYTKKNDSDISMLKYASSAAHISGKRLTSSETFTWLTEHFRTSLSQCKPDFDLMMVAGVNHCYFHGSCYSPQNAEWPGWRFYASVDMSPNNNWWDDLPAFTKYIERVQSVLQYGEPDNDVLVYLPYYDMIFEQPGRLLQFDIHSMAKKAPNFIKSITGIISSGYDCDYISDNYLQKTTYDASSRSLTTDGKNSYSAIVVPNVRFMPLETIEHLVQLASKGANIIVQGDYPRCVPGLGRQGQQKQFKDVVARLRSLTSGKTLANSSFLSPEPMRTDLGLSVIRRAVPEGHYYFISNLQKEDVCATVRLGKPARSAYFFNPMNGKITRGRLSHDENGNPQLLVQLYSGESVILLTTTRENDYADVAPHKYYSEDLSGAVEISDMKMTFTKVDGNAPEKKSIFSSIRDLSGRKSFDWTQFGVPELSSIMGTAKYTFSFLIKEGSGTSQSYILDLGDVRESARVSVNGKDVATLFAVPYKVDISEYIKSGRNNVEVEVSNLPANRIAKLDKDGVKWRKFKEINVVDLNYKNTLYDSWTPMPSGLCSMVRIIPCILR